MQTFTVSYEEIKQLTTVLTWKAYVEKKLRTSEINANIKQTS